MGDNAEQIIEQQNKLIDESLESTRRLAGLASEALMPMMLESQGEQLKRKGKSLDNIHVDKMTGKHNAQMGKWCGLCVIPWNNSKKTEVQVDTEVETSQDRSVVSSQPSSSGQFITRCGLWGK